jgi:hypothetical protein
MKKFYLIILAVFITSLSSCSSDDNGSSNSNIQINPPNWIQGKWLLKGAVVGESGFRFTSNDFLLIQVNMEISQKALLKQSVDIGQNVTTTEDNTENSYTLILNFAAGQIMTYSFTRISDSEITWNTVNNSIYTKQ